MRINRVQNIQYVDQIDLNTAQYCTRRNPQITTGSVKNTYIQIPTIRRSKVAIRGKLTASKAGIGSVYRTKIGNWSKKIANLKIRLVYTVWVGFYSSISANFQLACNKKSVIWGSR